MSDLSEAEKRLSKAVCEFQDSPDGLEGLTRGSLVRVVYEDICSNEAHPVETLIYLAQDCVTRALVSEAEGQHLLSTETGELDKLTRTQRRFGALLKLMEELRKATEELQKRGNE